MAYANRYTDPLAIAVHKERSRLYARLLVSQGRCASCGQPHERISQRGTRAHRCEDCAHKAQSYGQAHHARARQAMEA